MGRYLVDQSGSRRRSHAGEIEVSKAELEELRQAGLAGQRYASSKAAAKYLGTVEGTLRNWRCDGGGPKFEHAGRTRRFIRYGVDVLVRFKRAMLPAS